MNAKKHYDNHLGNFYAWMSGDFVLKQQEQEKFFRNNNILADNHKTAIDLGAGHGLQSVSLARLGFSVKAIDFNQQQLDELSNNGKDYAIEIIKDEILSYVTSASDAAGLIVCMGDTVTHLKSYEEVKILIREIQRLLEPGGKVILSFRDLTSDLTSEQRFIPVKSDHQRILTCFLEYFTDHVMVYDLLHEKQDDQWIQRVSAYPKLRLSQAFVEYCFSENRISLVKAETINRMIYLIGEKRKD